MRLVAQGPRRFVLLAGIAMLVLVVAACGRKSALSPPEDEAELYAYPSRYPAPTTVGPVKAEDELPERSFLQPMGRSSSTTTTTEPNSP
jgi:predicted small lipoprotein YifL